MTSAGDTLKGKHAERPDSLLRRIAVRFGVWPLGLAPRRQARRAEGTH
jgi:hypothetical protein